MTLSINTASNNDFNKWAASGMGDAYVVPIKELLPKSACGNIAKRINKIGEFLYKNSLDFSDLSVLSKVITEDGHFKKTASITKEDSQKIEKISCVIKNREVFKDIVKTSGLFGGIMSGLSMIPGVGAVVSGGKAAWNFIKGDMLGGVINLIVAGASFIPGGGAVAKGLGWLFKLVSKGGGGILKAVQAAGKMGLVQKILGFAPKIISAITGLLKKFKLGKWASKVGGWLKGMLSKIKNIFKGKAGAKAGTEAGTKATGKGGKAKALMNAGKGIAGAASAILGGGGGEETEDPGIGANKYQPV
jgi:hypothetical protein